MKKNILIITIFIFVSGCVTVGQPNISQRVLINWQNQNLVRWYQQTFYPQIDDLDKHVRGSIHMIGNSQFLGAKIHSYSSSIKTLEEEKRQYRLIHSESLRLYVNYIESLNGHITKYKPFLTQKVVDELNILRKQDNRNRLKGCNYKNTLIAKVNNNIHSTFIDVACLYTVKDVINPKDVDFLRSKGLNRAIEHTEFEGYVGVINAEEIHNILNTMRNSSLKESIIN
jgi:hypothetical protein